MLPGSRVPRDEKRVKRDGKRTGRGVALFWDESFLWGIMAYHALRGCGLPFDLVRSADIRKGRMKDYSVLFVPGGWSLNKMKALGEKGVKIVRRFVHDGGTYIGFCGGAGLATLDGMGLLNIKRRPTKYRVPSFSGRIRLKTTGHPLWEGIREPVFQAWWPPQFDVQDDSVKILATYQEALPDSFTSDLNAGDISAAQAWEELERIYGINLDPGRLVNDPAVLEGAYGKGKVILSLVHFDTPNDENGRQVLINLWSRCGSDTLQETRSHLRKRRAVPQAASHPLVETCEAAVQGLIDLGIRNFLWFWRNPMLLQWRRGVRGLEYCTLFVMMREISESLGQSPLKNGPSTKRRLKKITRGLLYFTDRAKNLLVRERIAMQSGHITYERCDDPEIQQLREELFSSSKSYGGLFKVLIDEIDGLLFLMLAGEKNSST